MSHKTDNLKKIGFLSFCADPSVEGLASAPDEGSYAMRVGILLGTGTITVGQARALLAQRGIRDVTVLDGLPDDYRPGAPRAPLS